MCLHFLIADYGPGYAQNFAHILNFYLLAMLFTASIMIVLCSNLHNIALKDH